MSSAAPQSTETKSRAASGRKEKDGTEKVITLQPLRVRLKHLAALHDTHVAARDNYNAGVKKVAEDCGLMSSVVNKLIKARAKDTVFDEARKAEQLSMIFAEIGGEAEPERQSTLDSMNNGAAKPPKNGNGKAAKNGNGEEPPIGDGAAPAVDPLKGTDLESGGVGGNALEALSQQAREGATRSPAVKPPRPGAH
jgi:hypothetical protein